MHHGTEFLGVLEFFSRKVRQPDEQLSAMMISIACQISQLIERRGAEGSTGCSPFAGSTTGHGRPG